MNSDSILHEITEACFVIDAAGHVALANDAALRLTGQKSSDLIGKPLPIDQPLGWKDAWTQARQSKRPVYRRLPSADRQHWLEMQATPAGDTVLLLWWQSPLHSAEALRLERHANQLHDTIQELESLSYTISHDLRAPLRHVEAFAGLLEQSLAGKLDAATTEYLTVIGQSARQMSKLLDGVLSYSRLCRRELHRTPVSLDSAVKSVLQELKLDMEGRKIEWDIQPLPEVQADPWMMRQVFAHLLSNALKFTRSRDVARITISATETADEIIVCVADNGIGFDMQYVNRLFGLFQRLHSDAQLEGIGVGLAHLRRMVLRHGGRVWAEAKPNVGAKFFAALPKS